MTFEIEILRVIVVLCLVSIQVIYSGDHSDMVNVCTYEGTCTKTITYYGHTIQRKYTCKKYEQCDTTWGRWSPCTDSFGSRKRVGKCVGTNCRTWRKEEKPCPPPTTTAPPTTTTPTISTTFEPTLSAPPAFMTTVCYTLAGSGGLQTCFSNDVPFINAQGYLPQSPDRLRTKFALYTRSGQRELINPDDLASSSTLQKRDTKIIIHGYRESGDEEWAISMAVALLELGDFNIIVVDWVNGARIINYFQAVANTRLVGAQVGFLVKALEDSYNIARADVHLIGFSLGAHTAGYAGKSMPGIGRISGLDPAGPAFFINDPQIRLTKDDAIYVDVLHTNGGTSITEGLGLFEPIGKTNFYPNGGKRQPGCVLLSTPANFTAIENPELLYFSEPVLFCSHGRAPFLYIESIKRSCSFQGYPCDVAQIENRIAPLVCNSCGAEGCARTGYYSLDDRANVNYYLTTTRRKPFC